MKNTIIIFLTTIVLFSCKKDINEAAVFNFVDISFSDTWTVKISVHVDSSKVAHILVEKRNSGKTYYIGKIKDSTFYKVNSLIKFALLNKFDNEIGQSPPDGSLSGIIISSKTKQIRSMLFDHDKPNTLDSIITELSVLNNYTINKTTDTSFNFLSYEVITPKLEEVEFVPPVVKEDLIEK
jgi:hypothetical protein